MPPVTPLLEFTNNPLKERVPMTVPSTQNPAVDILTGFLNGLVSKNNPAINKLIDDIIVKNGLDPLLNVFQGPIVDAGSFELNISLNNLNGLASLTVNSIALDSLHLSDSDTTKVIGAIQLSASTGGLTGDFDVQVKIPVPVGIPVLFPIPVPGSFDITGHVSVSKATIASNGTVVLTSSSVRCDSLPIQVNLEGISVNLNNVPGIISGITDSIVTKITQAFQDKIQSLIAGKIGPIIQDNLNTALEKI